MCLVIDRKIRNRQEDIGYLAKIHLFFKSVCFNNDSVITQHA